MKRKPTRRAKPKREFAPEAYDEIPRAALVLTDEAMYLTRFANGIPVESRPVAAADVETAFHVGGFNTGLLPADALFWQTRGSTPRYGIWIAPAVRELHFSQGRRTITLKLPLPGFVLIGKGVTYHVFAAMDRPAKPDAQLYHAPLPNVGDDGRICAGNVKFPKAGPATMGEAARLFFESDFNSDLSQGKVQCQLDAGDDDTDDDEVDDGDISNLVREPEEPPKTLLEFLKSIAGQRAFPKAELVPAMTISQLLSGGKDGN